MQINSTFDILSGFSFIFLFLLLVSVSTEKSRRSLRYLIASLSLMMLGGVFTYMHVLSCDFHIVFFFFFIGSYYIYIWIILLMYRDWFICCLLIVYIG
jgi:hypothetical protein